MKPVRKQRKNIRYIDIHSTDLDIFGPFCNSIPQESFMPPKNEAYPWASKPPSPFLRCEDPCVADSNGWTPLHHCAALGKASALRLLLIQVASWMGSVKGLPLKLEKLIFFDKITWVSIKTMDVVGKVTASKPPLRACSFSDPKIRP